MRDNPLFLGEIRYKPSLNWLTITKLINAQNLQVAECKLRKWADKNLATKDYLIIISETL